MCRLSRHHGHAKVPVESHRDSLKKMEEKRKEASVGKQKGRKRWRFRRIFLVSKLLCVHSVVNIVGLYNLLDRR